MFGCHRDDTRDVKLAEVEYLNCYIKSTCLSPMAN